ncbi:MAG: NUDIX hydrolase [Actinobacteria bacterium]|nr:NUDIX hydrolase [Actinomycetota bacterium]
MNNEQKAHDILNVLGFGIPQTDEDFNVGIVPDEDVPPIEEKILSSERAWDGEFLHVDIMNVELPSGKHATRDIVRHPGAVAVIAIDDENRLLLVQQYRASLERITLEIPAGKLDAGEEAEECARRELEEETGYSAGKMAYLVPIAVAAGYSDEIIHLFMATDLTAGPACPDEDEFVVSQWMDLRDFIDLVLDGQIEDSKTIIAALLCDAIDRRL